TKLCK
ncbi:Transcription-repair-coupling factor, partial [Haemophilus influenzae]